MKWRNLLLLEKKKRKILNIEKKFVKRFGKKNVESNQQSDIPEIHEKGVKLKIA